MRLEEHGPLQVHQSTEYNDDNIVFAYMNELLHGHLKPTCMYLVEALYKKCPHLRITCSFLLTCY